MVRGWLKIHMNYGERCTIFRSHIWHHLFLFLIRKKKNKNKTQVWVSHIKGGRWTVIECIVLPKTKWPCFAKCTWKNVNTWTDFCTAFLQTLGCQRQKCTGSYYTFEHLAWSGCKNPTEGLIARIRTPRRLSLNNTILPSPADIQSFAIAVTSLIGAGRGNSNLEWSFLRPINVW